MTEHDFWYIACQSHELRSSAPVSAQILGEWIAVFRDSSGKAVAIRDHCLHRCARLSKGTVKGGHLVCPYHGWSYNGDGQVVKVPSEGPNPKMLTSRKSDPYDVMEQEGYVYVRLLRGEVPRPTTRPFGIPEYSKPGWTHVRLVNRFQNTVTNCAENFVDIPHTVSVHPGIFRVERGEEFEALVRRTQGRVEVSYRGERANLGWFSWFINPSGQEIKHTDTFFMPNITSVRYDAGPNRKFIITSQSIPVTDSETLVYTDLTYDYGIWSKFAIPLVRRQAQIIIDQDVVILANQMEGIKKYGSKFMNSEADVIHVMIESIREAIQKGQDPLLLPEQERKINFWV